MTALSLIFAAALAEVAGLMVYATGTPTRPYRLMTDHEAAAEAFATRMCAVTAVIAAFAAGLLL